MIKNNEFNQEWIELLSQGNHREEIRFFDTMKDSHSLELAIMKYRRILREEGRGEITLEDLKINMDNKDKLQDLLQELFLEPIGFIDWWMDFFYEAVEEKYKSLEEGIEKLYLKHERDPSTRFLSIVLTL